jgi:hypothetical protein
VTQLMTAPYTAPTRAHTVVMTAGSANDSSTLDRRLGIVQHTATDPPPAPIALQRWESDGGAVQ